MSYNDELSNFTLSLNPDLCVLAFSHNTMDKEHHLHKNNRNRLINTPLLSAAEILPRGPPSAHRYTCECLLNRGASSLVSQRHLTSLGSPTEAHSWVLRFTFHSMNMAKVTNNCVTFPLQITLDLSPGVSSTALQNRYISSENLWIPISVNPFRNAFARYCSVGISWATQSIFGLAVVNNKALEDPHFR